MLITFYNPEFEKNWRIVKNRKQKQNAMICKWTEDSKELSVCMGEGLGPHPGAWWRVLLVSAWCPLLMGVSLNYTGFARISVVFLHDRAF